MRFVIAALLLFMVACGEAEPVDRVLYDSDPTGPPAGPGVMGGPSPRRVWGNTSRWHERRLQIRGVPVVVLWETLNTHGCDNVVRVLVAREGDPDVDVRARRVEAPEGAPSCADPAPSATTSPFDTAAVSIEWTEPRGCEEPATGSQRIRLQGNGRSSTF